MTYSYENGSVHWRSIEMSNGISIGEFLVRKESSPHFNEFSWNQRDSFGDTNKISAAINCFELIATAAIVENVISYSYPYIRWQDQEYYDYPLTDCDGLRHKKRDWISLIEEKNSRGQLTAVTIGRVYLQSYEQLFSPSRTVFIIFTTSFAGIFPIVTHNLSEWCISKPICGYLL